MLQKKVQKFAISDGLLGYYVTRVPVLALQPSLGCWRWKVESQLNNPPTPASLEVLLRDLEKSTGHV